MEGTSAQQDIQSECLRICRGVAKAGRDVTMCSGRTRGCRATVSSRRNRGGAQESHQETPHSHPETSATRRGRPSSTAHSLRTLSLPPVMSIRVPGPCPDAPEGTHAEHVTPPSPAALTSDLRAQEVEELDAARFVQARFVSEVTALERFKKHAGCVSMEKRGRARGRPPVCQHAPSGQLQTVHMWESVPGKRTKPPAAGSERTSCPQLWWDSLPLQRHHHHHENFEG